MLSRGGQPHLPRAAVEQRDAELLLELAHRRAERRLGHVQALGRASEVALLGDGDEVPDESQLGLHVGRSYAPRISNDRIGLGQMHPGSSSWIAVHDIRPSEEHPMSKLLYVISSPRGEQSESGAIADAFLDAHRQSDPSLEVDVLDLWTEPLPVYARDGVAAKMAVFAGQTPSGDQAAAWAEVQRIFARFNAADEYLFTVPMWNHGVPWVLKHLIDTISQPGMVFGFDPATGYTGLLAHKRAVVVYTSAVYHEGAPSAFGADFHRAYFNDWLRWAGIEEVSEIRFQPNLVTTDAEAGRAIAKATASALGNNFARSSRLAA
jgi:FMN-dependent NADH-azoreductase